MSLPCEVTSNEAESGEMERLDPPSWGRKGFLLVSRYLSYSPRKENK